MWRSPCGDPRWFKARNVRPDRTAGPEGARMRSGSAQPSWVNVCERTPDRPLHVLESLTRVNVMVLSVRFQVYLPLVGQAAGPVS